MALTDPFGAGAGNIRPNTYPANRQNIRFGSKGLFAFFVSFVCFVVPTSLLLSNFPPKAYGSESLEAAKSGFCGDSVFFFQAGFDFRFFLSEPVAAAPIK
jgi:hypothetical protein